MKAGCLSPRAQAGQLGRMQGLRTSAKEPLMAGQSFSNWSTKRWRRFESGSVGFFIVYVYHITYIHTYIQVKNVELQNFRFPAVTEALLSGATIACNCG